MYIFAILCIFLLVVALLAMIGYSLYYFVAGPKQTPA